MKSIYEEIVEELKRNDGVLGEDFAPEAALVQLAMRDEDGNVVETESPFDEGEGEEGPFTPHWAPGALDGVLLYHTAPEEPTEKDIENTGKAIERLVSEGEMEFLETLAEIEIPTIWNVGAIHDYIMERQEDLDPNIMVSRALNIMEGAHDLEAIKFALAISALVDLSVDKHAVEVVRNLSRYDEFTVFCIYNFLAWQEMSPEKEILDAAKHVTGWGRVHAVSSLDMVRNVEGVSNETKDWVFVHGVENGVLPSYTAEPSFMISECEKKIEEELNVEDLGNLADIMAALFEEPQYGINSIELEEGTIDDMIKKMLAKAEGFLDAPPSDDEDEVEVTTAKLLRMVMRIKEYLSWEDEDLEEDEEDEEELCEVVDEELLGDITPEEGSVEYWEISGEEIAASDVMREEIVGICDRIIGKV